MYDARAKERDIPHGVTLFSGENAVETFHWVDTLTSNLKALIDGSYDGRKQYKQWYAAQWRID